MHKKKWRINRYLQSLNPLVLDLHSDTQQEFEDIPPIMDFLLIIKSPETDSP